MRKRYLFIVVLLLIICGCSKNKITNKEIKMNDYRIKYTNNSNEYLLNIKDNNIYVEKYNIVICVKAPCNPIKTDAFSEKFTSEYKVFIDSLFKDTNSNEITITNNNLSEENIKILSKIIKEEITTNDITYKIIKENYDNPNYINKGYYINNNIISISMGEKNTGGYNLSIDSIIIDNNSSTIYIKENVPPMGATVTQAFTYPTIDIEFNKLPNNLKVINKDTNEEYITQKK